MIRTEQDTEVNTALFVAGHLHYINLFKRQRHNFLNNTSGATQYTFYTQLNRLGQHASLLEADTRTRHLNVSCLNQWPFFIVFYCIIIVYTINIYTNTSILEAFVLCPPLIAQRVTQMRRVSQCAHLLNTEDADLDHTDLPVGHSV